MNQSGTQQQNASQGLERSINMAEIALRGSSTLMDIQLSTLRNVAHIQARSAALFGLPDCSEIFNATDKLIQCQLSAATDQLLSSTRQISQAYADAQRQFGRAIEQGTTQLAQEIRQSVDEIGQRARQGMQEFSSNVEQQTGEIQKEVQKQAGEVQNRSGNGQGESGNMNMGHAEESSRKTHAQSRKA